MGHRCWLAEGASLTPLQFLQGQKNTQLTTARRFGLLAGHMERERGTFKGNRTNGAEIARHG
jgi:hypothetical protein